MSSNWRKFGRIVFQGFKKRKKTYSVSGAEWVVLNKEPLQNWQKSLGKLVVVFAENFNSRWLIDETPQTPKNNGFKVIWVFPKMVGFPPKSSMLIGFSIINHPFWDTPIFGNTHIVSRKSDGCFFKIQDLHPKKQVHHFCESFSDVLSDFL